MQLIQQEDIAIANVYTPKTEAPNYRRQIFRGLSTELDSKTTWVLHYPHLQQWTNHLGQKKKSNSAGEIDDSSQESTRCPRPAT